MSEEQKAIESIKLESRSLRKNLIASEIKQLITQAISKGIAKEDAFLWVSKRLKKYDAPKDCTDVYARSWIQSMGLPTVGDLTRSIDQMYK